jgi:hypothetical protein
MNDVHTRKVLINEEHRNLDPISGTPGAHPVGTGAGAASGGMAGAAVGGAVGGPIGAIIGAAVGAVAGGLVGKSAAEAISPTVEESFWRETYVREPYYVSGRNYEYYAPGFRAGWEGRVRLDGRSFNDAERELKAAYNASKSELDPEWQDIRPAARAAWDRVDLRWNAAQQ